MADDYGKSNATTHFQEGSDQLDESALDGDLTPEEKAELQSILDEQKAEAEPEKPEEPEKDEAALEAAAADDGEEAEEAEEPASDEPDPGEPQVEHNLVDSAIERYMQVDFQKVYGTLDQQRADQRTALRKQYDDGDLDAADYAEKIDELSESFAKRRADISAIESQVLIAKERLTTSEQQFDEATQRFLENEDNLKYRDNPFLRRQFESAMEAVFETEEAQGKSWDWVLAKSKRYVEEALGNRASNPSAFSKPPGDKPKPDRAFDEQKKVAEAPKTLAQAPMSDGQGDGEDKYDFLNTMDIDELERWMARHPDEADAALRQVS